MSCMKGLHRPALLTALCAAAALPPAAAQTSAIESVVITAPRVEVPLNAAQVGASDLRPLRAATSDAASLLRGVPGVSLYGAGGVSSLPAVHGLGGDRLRVQVDGMDLIASCPNHMNPALSYVDPSQVGVLRVYAGITPVSVGGDSIGGTIVAETPAPPFAAPGEGSLVRGEAGAFYRSNGEGRGANVSAAYASESLSLSFSGASARAENYRAGRNFKTTTDTGRPGHALPLDEVGSSAYETRNYTLGVALRGAHHLVEAKLGHQDMPTQLYPNQRMDLLANVQNRLNMRYLGRFAWGALEVRGYRETVEHFMDFGPDRRFWYGSNSGAGSPCAPIRFSGDPAGTCAAGMPMHTQSRTSGATLKADIGFGERDFLRLGGEYQRYRLGDWWPASGGGMGPGTFWNINDGRRDRIALFGEWELRPAPLWMVSLGARYERVATQAGVVRGYSTAAGSGGNQVADAAAFNSGRRQRTDGNWDFTALARYTADPTRDIEFGFARKVRSPNLYERYAWSTWAMAATMNNFAGDGNGYVGNPDLRPEVAHTFSATFDWHAADRARALKVTPFLTHVADYIDAVKRPGFLAGQFNVLGRANQRARIHGFDLSGHTPLASNRWGEWGLQGVLNYARGSNRDTGDALYNFMPVNLRLTLTHRLGGWDNGVELVAVRAKEHIADVRNEIGTPGYGVLNLRLSRSWKSVRVDFGIENLFDRFHALPLGGAYLGQGRSMSMNGVPWGVAVPGKGRSMHAGLTVKF